ncbi:Alkaline serine exoprotease A precursor [Alloactinosynnema sp. L-07]|uniref:S8 family peptidase n=1 Tax=Alloactinosynnema sp. L-07 TaxID=1653480 RepID=UPI00065EF57C|nr:S8 family serine peptidase [Alloactinosynnema sp. L-07]CRK56037.1 Alkaline serine exoprotease A precursor [Alloactinosynnema sp. L-07]
MRIRTTLSAKKTLGAGLAAAAAITAAVVMPNSASAAEGTILAEGSAEAIKDSYIVVLKDNLTAQADVSGRAGDLASRYNGKVGFTYQAALRGFSVTMSAQQARRLAADPAVSYVEQDRAVKMLTDQLNPTWGLDRVDQRDLPLNQKYTYNNGASNVTAYIIDTGINYNHTDFGGRATFGFDAFSDGQNGKDCQGHGTHVAGTVGGTTYGVAKEVKLKAVRVLNCQGGGSVSTEAAGVDWVTANAVLPAVANMSLYTGTANEPSTVLDTAVKNSIAKGVTYVVAAGNFNDDSCKYSPQRVRETINVGNSTSSDARASTSSYGVCTDLYAPGSSIVSASHSNNSGTATMSGTSMASPHVAGGAALYLAGNAAATPAQVHQAIIDSSTPNKITNPGTGTPNRLLFVGGVTPGGVSVTNPGNQTSTVGTAISPLQLSASGGSAPYTWSATGLPTGLSISASGAVSGTPSASGVYNVTATATDSSSPAKSATTSFTWTINTIAGCAPQTNGTDVAIADSPGAAVTSTITMSGCSGNGSATSKVEVHIKHTWRGDLVIDLVAPDGTAYRLKNSSSSDSADNVDATYTVNLSSEARNGAWKLKVQDVARYDTGNIDTWTLTL